MSEDACIDLDIDCVQIRLPGNCQVLVTTDEVSDIEFLSWFSSTRRRDVESSPAARKGWPVGLGLLGIAALEATNTAQLDLGCSLLSLERHRLTRE